MRHGIALSHVALSIGLFGLVLCLAGCPPSTPPIAAFAASTQDGYASLLVDFTDQSLAGSDEILTWSWTFGDGASSPSQHPSHVYTAPGVYSVSLTVSSDAGANTLTQNDWITVRDPDVDVLIVHRSASQIEAAQLATVLESRGLTSRIFYRSSDKLLTSLDLSLPGMVILCSDVLSLDSSERNYLAFSGAQILATGASYHVFGEMGLHIAEAATSSGRGLKVAEAAHAVFNAPNDLDVADGDQVDLYTPETTVSTPGMYLGHIPDTANVTVLAYTVPSINYASLIMEDDRFMVWGFSGHFDLLSVPGLDLLENCVRYLMR